MAAGAVAVAVEGVGGGYAAPLLLGPEPRTRSGDLARFTFKGLGGTMTHLFIHLVAYQLVTLPGTGVSVLDEKKRSL